MNLETLPHDVFLSHSAKDKAVVRASSLSAPTGDWAQLETGTCGRGNCWERRFALRDPLNQERRFLPLRLDDAPIKGSLAPFHCATNHTFKG